ncbi:MAG: hypothetical protein O4804_03085 [Trichodesmium sp. St11_bin5]|nr:hypothetical protein [Trichodesmium sp. St11_bin5]
MLTLNLIAIAPQKQKLIICLFLLGFSKKILTNYLKNDIYL